MKDPIVNVAMNIYTVQCKRPLDFGFQLFRHTLLWCENFGFQCKPMFLKHFVNIPFNVIEFGLVFRMPFNYLLWTHLKCMNCFWKRSRMLLQHLHRNYGRKLKYSFHRRNSEVIFEFMFKIPTGMNVVCFEAITISMEKLSVFNFEKQQF